MISPESTLYGGIDPGQTGGLGLIDHQGKYLGAWRWDKKDPASLYRTLFLHQSRLKLVLIEAVGIFPGKGAGFAQTMQPLILNAGVWRGWLMALDIAWGELHPAAWLSRHGLHRWKKKLETDPNQITPIKLARRLWPDAPLLYQADDGKAVGLLLADLARTITTSPQVAPSK